MKGRLSGLLLPLIVAGCMEGQKQAPVPRRPSLYTDVGETRLEKVAEHFVARASASPRLREPVRAAIREADEGPLKNRLVRRLGAVLGGPYPGGLEDLRQFFVSLAPDLDSKDMAVLLGLLDRSLEDSAVGPRSRQEVMTILEPLRGLRAGRED